MNTKSAEHKKDRDSGEAEGRGKNGQEGLFDGKIGVPARAEYQRIPTEGRAHAVESEHDQDGGAA